MALPGTNRRVLSLAQDALLIVVSTASFTAHAQSAMDGRWTSLGFAIEQALLVGIFLTRRRSIATSTRPFDWLIAAGGWLSLLARPADAPGEWAASLGIGIQTVGLVLTIIGFAYLGRSFGVVAANRGLKVGGPYRFVRHPIYLSHTLTTTGFVLANFSAWNVGVLVLLTACQVLRMNAEERVLTESGPYADYAKRVRWRLVPGLY
jgi:protein-S-isoprenylcysteine O-methyltransferase Ste14